MGVQSAREAVWRRRRKRLGKRVRRGELSSSRLLAPRISARRLKAAVDAIRPDIPAAVREAYQGADLALVGPGERGLSAAQLAEIPLVARMGFLGPDSVPPGTSARCDIGFYTGLHSARLVNLLEAGDLPELPPTGVFRPDVDLRSIEPLSGHLDIIAFDTRPVAELFRGILPNFGAEVIACLLALSPRRLVISHVDLFTSRRYPAGYANKDVGVLGEHHLQREVAAVRRSLSWHNPFTHFSFYGTIRAMPNVELAGQLERVLSEGPRAYQRTLEDLYFREVDEAPVGS